MPEPFQPSGRTSGVDMENRRCRSLQKSLQVWAAETCCMKVPTALLRPMSTLFGCLSAQALCQKLSWWLRMFKSLKNLRDFVTLCMSCQQISSPSTVSNQTETTPALTPAFPLRIVHLSLGIPTDASMRCSCLFLATCWRLARRRASAESHEWQNSQLEPL